MSEADREDISHRIETAEARNRMREAGSRQSTMERVGEKVVEAKDSFTEFAREHPFTVVIGGLALGVAVSALFPRSPTRKAAAKVGGLGGKAAALASLAAEAAALYANQAFDAANDAARAGKDKLEDVGDTVGDTARHLRRDASYYADSAAHAARKASRETGKKVRRAVKNRH